MKLTDEEKRVADDVARHYCIDGASFAAAWSCAMAFISARRQALGEVGDGEEILLTAANNLSHSAFLVMHSGFRNALAKIEALRLTDAEREAVGTAARIAGAVGESDVKATLLGFLDRHAEGGGQGKS